MYKWDSCNVKLNADVGKVQHFYNLAENFINFKYKQTTQIIVKKKTLATYNLCLRHSTIFPLNVSARAVNVGDNICLFQPEIFKCGLRWQLKMILWL